MLENGIAEPTTSAWSSPCILVMPDGTFRFCTDYRKVNAVTKPDSYPLPRMDDCIDSVGSATFVSKFDLLKGYWQVPLTDRAKKNSAFVIPDGLFQYKVMAFGMRNAPAAFQCLVNMVLSGLPGCAAYLDDVVVYSTSWPEHIMPITTLFDRLSQANVAECVFLPARWRYVVISAYSNPSHFFCDPSHLPVIWKVGCAVVQYVGGTSLVLVLINVLLQPLTTCV